jgi:type II secretory pathway pseudopilin PulG
MKMTRASTEAGMTVLELMVALALLSVVGVILTSFFISAMSTTSRATTDSETEKKIELAIRPITEDIRSASAISSTYPSSPSCSTGSYPSGYANCLSFTVARPTSGQLTCPRSVFVIGVKSGVLRMDRSDYGVVNGLCNTVRTVSGYPLLMGITTGTPLFTYFDNFGNPLNPSAAGQTTGPFVAAGTVRVTLNVAYQTGAPLLSYTSDLAMRNNR